MPNQINSTNAPTKYDAGRHAKMSEQYQQEWKGQGGEHDTTP